MTLSIVIVNWNSKDLLRQCLLSVRCHCTDLEPQLIVVDGGSFDGCGEMLAAEFPEVEFIQSPDNVGFGRANNLGFTRVTRDTVLLLNPDTIVQAGAVQKLLAELQRRPDAGMVGPRLVSTDLRLKASVHALPKPVRQALDSEILRRLLWPLGLWAPPTDFVPREVIPVETISGACMLIGSKIYRQVGGFSPQYFMYAEDADLCFKVLRAGLKIYHVPDSQIVHFGGASTATQGNIFSAVMMREALHLYMVVNHGQFQARLYRAATAASALMHLLIVAPSALVGEPGARLAGRAALGRWWSVLSWSFGQQKWTKKYA